MKKSILAVCDTEQEYAYHFMDYLSQTDFPEKFPFEIQVFTDPGTLEQFCTHTPVQFLLISQSLYEKKDSWNAQQILVLAEEEPPPAGPLLAGPPGPQMAGFPSTGSSLEGAPLTGMFPEEPSPAGRAEVPWIGKYQPVEAVVRKVMEIAAQSGLLPPAAQTGRPGAMKLIGVYSPIRRCLQTTFSFTLGQLLARRHKVLYLNFESYSGLARLLRQEFQTDLSDLIYFLHNGDGRFPYRLEGMARKLNGLDYIPPAFSCMDLQRVEKEEWLALFTELELSGMYEYVILDLSEDIQGLFDILKLCVRVYTIVREDSFAAAKQEQYEELLRCLSCEEILERTKKCRLPLFHQLPPGLDNLTRGELAETVARLIEEDLGA